MLRLLRRSMTNMSALDTPPIVVILGATGAGKSQLALELAHKFGGEIISADAMQMYRGLDIVTNKVSPQEQEMVKHHMINILDPLCHNNVVDFRNKALPVVESLLSEGRIPVICGGTNYYIESLLWKILVDVDLPFIVSGKRLIDSPDSDHKKVMKTEKSASGDTELIDWSNDDGSVSTYDLYKMLKDVDPERACVLHPKERRKIWRSLQIFHRTGQKHSQLLDVKGGNPESGFGGGLRFEKSKVCIIEVWSEQSVLETRCDKRVDKMMARGLVPELQQFHDEVNKRRAESGNLGALTYDKGIWQSIGFKEFHDYLCLSPEARDTEEGRRLFDEGVVKMKISTRQYSRKQAKWIRRRFLTNIRDSPPVFRVDSSDPTLWNEKVFEPAEKILHHFLTGADLNIEPLSRVCEHPERDEDYRKTLHCDTCDRDFKGEAQFRNHQKSKSHRKAVRALEEHFTYETKLLSFHQENKLEAAKILKNIFGIGLTDVMKIMENLPYTISQDNSGTKAKRIVNELSKHQIVAEVNRVKIEKEGELNEEHSLVASS